MKDKVQTPLREGRRSFSRPTPYTRPPPSSTASGSGKSRASSGLSSTRMPSASSAKASLSAKLEDLDNRSELLLEGAAGQSTSRSALRYNYAIRKQELDNQREELASRQKLKELELEIREKDIRLREQEERNYERQIELLRLQFQVGRAQPSAPPSSGPQALAGGSTDELIDEL